MPVLHGSRVPIQLFFLAWQFLSPLSLLHEIREPLCLSPAPGVVRPCLPDACSELCFRGWGLQNWEVIARHFSYLEIGISPSTEGCLAKRGTPVGNMRVGWYSAFAFSRISCGCQGLAPCLPLGLHGSGLSETPFPSQRKVGAARSLHYLFIIPNHSSNSCAVECNPIWFSTCF